MKCLICSVLLFIALASFSQNTNPGLDNAEAKTANIEFNGGKYIGYLLELNAPPDIVEEAIKQRFKLQGAKPKETKGFMVYRNVLLPMVDAAKPMDAFIKVERKSRKEKEQTTVYLITALPGEIPEDKLKSDAAKSAPGLNEKSRFFLTGMVPDIKLGVYNKDVVEQQSQLKKEEKKLANLVDDYSDMEKKLKKLQSDIEFNKKAQERQIADIGKAKNTLNDLLSKNPSKDGQ